MTRLLIATGVVAAMVAGAFFFGISWERERRAAQDARDYIEGTQDADTATDDVRRVGACNWLQRTFGGEGCGVAGPDTPVD